MSPLLECSDVIIRDGIRALLDQKLEEAELKSVEQQALGWTAAQGADQRLLAHLRRRPDDPVKPTDLAERATALARFRTYAYQWY